MDFDLSEEQKLIAASVGKVLSKSQAPADAAQTWKDFAEAGLLGMGFDAEHGGLGTGPVETMIVMREIGRALCCAPYLAGVVHGAALFNSVAPADLRASLIPDLVEGNGQLAVVLGHGGVQPNGVAAEPRGGGFALRGQTLLVPGGATATHFIVSARLSNVAPGGEPIALFLIPRTARGLDVSAFETIDGRSAADIAFHSVEVGADALLVVENAEAHLAAAEDHAMAAVANEAAGAMEELLSVTVDYLKTRRQFGSALASFQVVQHRAVDMLIEVEQAKSLALYATMQLHHEPAQRRDAILSAKLHVNKAARIVGEMAVQLHGAIGMTLENKTGRLFNRLTACQVAFGDSDTLLARLLRATPDILAA